MKIRVYFKKKLNMLGEEYLSISSIESRYPIDIHTYEEICSCIERVISVKTIDTDSVDYLNYDATFDYSMIGGFHIEPEYRVNVSLTRKL